MKNWIPQLKLFYEKSNQNNKMKKVLIALDNSSFAHKIAKTGHCLAKSMEAQTILLHVLSDRPYYAHLDYSPIMGLDGLSTSVKSETWDELHKVASSYLDKLKEVLGSENIDTIIKQGDFSETILETATELKVDFIVMGTHSRRGLKKILLGSVAHKILQESPIPLFIVPVKSYNTERVNCDHKSN